MATKTTHIDPMRGKSIGASQPAVRNDDVEKKGEDSTELGAPPTSMEFPEGGLMGWLCVLGATLIGQ